MTQYLLNPPRLVEVIQSHANVYARRTAYMYHAEVYEYNGLATITARGYISTPTYWGTKKVRSRWLFNPQTNHWYAISNARNTPDWVKRLYYEYTVSQLEKELS